MTTGRERLLILGAAGVAGAAAAAYFASQPAMRVRVGLEQIETLVPAHYQASVFPAFGAFAAALALDVARGRARGTRWRRAALAGTTGAIALARLAGAVPLSGHAVFLAAMLVHELCARDDARTPFGAALAAGGLAVTAWYKLALWDDAGWLAASSLAGAVAGGLAAAR